MKTQQELEVEEEEDSSNNDIHPLRLTNDTALNYEDTPYSNSWPPLLVILSFSPWGNMARIAMEDLITYTNAYVFYNQGTIIWVNFTACFIMGFANGSKAFWECFNSGSNTRISYKEMPLHAGVTAGFCACMSTLSALLMELFYKTTNNTLRKVPNHGYGVMEFFAIVLGQMGLCFFGMTLGRDAGRLLDSVLVPHLKPYLNKRVRIAIELSMMSISGSFYIANIVLAAVLPLDNWYRQNYALAIVFGPPATLLRYQLLYFNDRLAWFPLGTFICNTLASTLLSTLQILLYGYTSKHSQTLIITREETRWVLKALASGFGGSLSTIAALCYEIVNFNNPLHRYVYFFTTFIVCWGVVVLILGSYQWSVGIQPN